MAANCRIVVLGATGHFGGRLCRRLLNEPDVEIVVTSRSLQHAEQFASKLKLPSKSAANAKIVAAQIDIWSDDFNTQLASLTPSIVVHAVGPFQGQNYRVAKACIDCDSHYVDLADGREFVSNFSSLHAAAIDANVLLVSGASTLPGLSSAVVERLRPVFSRIDAIRSVISPAHQTPRGTATIAAVLSYCGDKFTVLDDGQWRTTFGWQDMKKHHHPELGSRLAAACDVPDLALFVEHVPGVQSVSFHASLESKFEHLALWCMSGLSRIRLVSDWRAMVPLVRWLNSTTMSLGSDRGGMTVTMTGTDLNNSRTSVQWSLTAENNHGPEIPCIPAVILIRRMARQSIKTRGAMPCLNLITLDEFDLETRDLDINWTIDE